MTNLCYPVFSFDHRRNDNTWHSEDVEKVVPHQQLHLAALFRALSLFVGHLVTPQSVFVVACKAVHNNGDG